MLGKAFKRKLAHSVAVATVALNNFVTMLKSFIANVIKCKARLKTKFKCAFITMHSLVMSPFSHNFIKADID